MKDGFIKVASATPAIRVADCAYNASEIIRQARQAAEKGAQLVVFPELCLTGYTCGDLFLHETLLRGALDALGTVCAQTTDLNAALVVGLPFAFGGKLYNCAAVVCAGRIAGLVPKQNVPNYAEFYEARHFAPGVGLEPAPAKACGQDTVFGTGLLFQCPELPALTLGVEICEDLWVPDAPSAALAQMGATVIANPSASDEVVGKAAYRRDLVRGQSARLLCAYVYADAGFGESTQDLVFAGHNLIAENGALLTESRRFESGLCYADVDLGRLVHERRRMNTFETMEAPYVAELRLEPLEDDLADRYVPATPFVPTDKGALEERCQEILTMQATGLATRLRHARCKDAVIGLSGGLDSTLALVVTVHAFDMLGLDRSGILAVTMPCFGTTARTKGNAEKLAEAYGATLRVVDIKAAVDQHFADIGHAKDDLNVTFENGQARMRTLVLMDLANEVGGLVVGTGDLSELALGWATYNGDHMSMYDVNASVPKTLIRHIIRYYSEHEADESIKAVLNDILDTPISPELLPAKDGAISQKTEDLVGPYELHDFFIYHVLRFGFSPAKIFYLAANAFDKNLRKRKYLNGLRFFIKDFLHSNLKGHACLTDLKQAA